MYLRAVHAEHDIIALRQFIKDNPLGLFISAIPSPTFPLIQCTHIPWVIDVVDDTSETELGKLRGHMARANPHSKALVEAVQGRTSTANDQQQKNVIEQEISVVFNGPAHHYVTPKFYTETKPATGKVVPTWNYAAVQVYGRARIFHDTSDPETGSYLQSQVEALTRHAEGSIMGYDVDGTGSKKAWAVGDAPEKYVDLLKKAIIGVEIEIDRLEGKYKMSQEMGDGDRKGVVDGFRALGTEEGEKMAQTVGERAAKKNEARR